MAWKPAEVRDKEKRVHDFCDACDTAGIRRGLRKSTKIADKAGFNQTSFRVWRRNPGQMSLERFVKLCETVQPTAEELYKMLGYRCKDASA